MFEEIFQGHYIFFNLLLYLCYPIMRSDEHTESKKQISLVDYSLIWQMPNFCEALPMGQIICCPYVYSVQSSILCFKKSRLRQLSNLPKVRPLEEADGLGVGEIRNVFFQDWPMLFHLFQPASIHKAINILESF